jgi:hypothetical protein
MANLFEVAFPLPYAAPTLLLLAPYDFAAPASLTAAVPGLVT